MKTIPYPDPAAVTEIRRLREEADGAVAHIDDHEAALDAMIREAERDAAGVEAEVKRLRAAGRKLPPFPSTEVPIPDALREVWAVRESISERHGFEKPKPEDPP